MYCIVGDGPASEYIDSMLFCTDIKRNEPEKGIKKASATVLYLLNLLNILFYWENVEKLVFIVLNTYNNCNVNSYLCTDLLPWTEPRLTDFTDLRNQCFRLCTVLDDLLSLFLTLLF